MVGIWTDQLEFFAFYKPQATTTEYQVFWKRNDPETSCPLFRVARGALTDWQWTKIFSFHAYGVVPVHVFESGNRTRGTLLFTGACLSRLVGWLVGWSVVVWLVRRLVCTSLCTFT